MPLSRRKRKCLSFLLSCTASSIWAQNVLPNVDASSAERGATLYASSCASCHGKSARGTGSAPDLIRSGVVLHDRFVMLHGKEFPAVLSKPPHKNPFTDAQLADLSQFLTQSVNNILRSGYSNEPVNMLTGNAKAGEAYFAGEGGCNKCHSVSGDLAGIGKRYSPAALQQKFLFPNSGFRRRGPQTAAAPVKTQVTVTSPDGQLQGALVRLDDFNVTLRDKAGQYHTVERTAKVKVDLMDPFAAHIALLDKYADIDIHNLLAYLVTIQ